MTKHLSAVLLSAALSTACGIRVQKPPGQPSPIGERAPADIELPAPPLKVADVYRRIREINSSYVVVDGQVTHGVGVLGRGFFRVADDGQAGSGILVLARQAIPQIGDRIQVRGWLCQEGVLQKEQLIVLYESPSKQEHKDGIDNRHCGIPVLTLVRELPWSRLLFHQ